jgi:L-fuconolactonase
VQRQTHRARVDTVRPVWDHLLECFGPGRLLWGSDWPMTLLTAGYTGTWEVMAELVGELTEKEQGKILEGTAQRVYRLSVEEE